MMSENKVKDALAVLSKALKEDEGFAYSWHCNVAVAFQNAAREGFTIHKIANEAATTFMKNAFDVDTSYDMLNPENKEK